MSDLWERIKNEPIIIVNTVVLLLGVAVTEGLIAADVADDWIRWIDLGLLLIATITGRHMVVPARKAEAEVIDAESYSIDHGEHPIPTPEPSPVSTPIPVTPDYDDFPTVDTTQ